MKWAQRQRTKTFLIALAFLAALGILLGWLSQRKDYRNDSTLSEPSPHATSPPLALVSPSSEVSPAATPSANKDPQSNPTPIIQTAGLIIPVGGVRAAQLLDTFSAAREDGRVHDAIDIADYAHLDRYADGLGEGRIVTQGETIAYVGDTGNAGAGNYHLHFSIAMTSDPKRWWDGVNINPYPLLRK